MTRNAWIPPSVEAELGRGDWRDSQLERRVINDESVLKVFRAWIEDDYSDLSDDRRPYAPSFGSSTTSTDTVFWNRWWPDYDPLIFNPTFVNELFSGQDCVAHVELLQPGLYAIQAAIDIEAEPPDNLEGEITVWIGSNYDESGTEEQFMDLDSDILGMWVLNQHRLYVPGTNADTGAEMDVEITFTHSQPITLYIPGGNGGFWGAYPHLTIAYKGLVDLTDTVAP